MAEQENPKDNKTEFEQRMVRKLQNLARLYNEVEHKNESDPMELQEKLTIYGDIYEVMGDLHAFAVGQEKLNYAYRKEWYAKAIVNKKTNPEQTKALTGKEKEHYAEIYSSKYRRLEAEYAYEGTRWMNRRQAVLEQINIMKRKQDGFFNAWDKANYINGYS